MQQVLSTLDAIKAVSSRNKKIELATMEALKNPLFRKTILYMVHPYKMYNLASIPISDTPAQFNVDAVFDCLDDLSRKSGATNADAQTLSNLASGSKEGFEIVNRILAKDSKCGLGLKTWNKIIPEIPIHETMLCIDDFDAFINAAGSWDNVCYSIKLDGVRCWAIVTEAGAVNYLSRNGKPYNNFSKFNPQLKKMAESASISLGLPYPIIFDGEMIAKGAAADFTKAMTQVRKLEDADSSIFKFCIFDLVESEHRTQMSRCAALSMLVPLISPDSDVEIHPHVFNHGFKCVDDVTRKLEEVVAKGHEGLVLKTTFGKYEKKRSKNWCKVKKFSTLDLPVVGMEEGAGKYTGTMGKLICEMNGVQIGVGSGYTDAERDEFYKSPPSLIEVKYFEKTADGSLRFPIFVRVREDK